MRTLTLAVLVLLVPVAGCAAPEGPAPSQSLPAAAASYDEDTGGVEGLVVDDALSPIQGAQVQLAGRYDALTDANGAFALSQIDPGTHVLIVMRLGYQVAQQNVDVFLREVTQVRVTLRPVGVEEPYHETQIGVALVGCGLGIRNEQLNSPPAGVGGLAVCPSVPREAQNASGIRDDFRVDFQVGSLANMTGAYGESTWESTQVLGTGIRVRWYFGAEDPLQLGPFLGERDGPSPLALRWTGDELRTNATVDPTSTASGSAGTVNAAYCLEDPCQFISMHYAGRNNLGSEYPADFGFGFQQRVEDYLTNFYFEEFPEGFSALPDQ